MHDITSLEDLGLPGAFVASTEFEHAAASQSASLGFKPNAVYVAHPIQDRTDDELQTLASEAMPRIIEALVAAD